MQSHAELSPPRPAARKVFVGLDKAETIESKEPYKIFVLNYAVVRKYTIKWRQLMIQEDLSIKVREKAHELGYDLCGIIKVDDIEEYAVRLEERIKNFPESSNLNKHLFKLAFPKKNYEWAKSIIICGHRYGKYKIPDGIEALIGKYYLYDYRHQEDSKEFFNKNLFESYLKEIGLKTANDDHVITAARWSAMKAGLGVIRKNNFLYTKNGSWVWLDAWLVDEEMEYIETPEILPCPPNCTKCMNACPTGALSGPFQLNRGMCITQLTTLS